MNPDIKRTSSFLVEVVEERVGRLIISDLCKIPRKLDLESGHNPDIIRSWMDEE
jgi:hypothetical protein